MTRNIIRFFAITCAGFFASYVAAAQQRTDPMQYESRIAKEVQPFLSNCTQQYSDANGVYDPKALAFCESSQAVFAEEYYNALEGDMNDKSDLGFMFQRGPQYGVKYDQTMACAWWIDTEDTGGRLPLNPFDSALADACRQSQPAVDEAQALEAEEAKVASLTY
jgi:hypothetical protein